MNIPVLLEPTPTGFRVSTGAPLNLTAEAPTAEEALKALRVHVVAKFAAGCRIVDLGEAVAKSVRALERLASDPQHERFVEAMAEYRKERETEDTEPATRPTSAPQPDATGIPQ